MSVLTQALNRANARKEAVWDGYAEVLSFDAVLLMLSGLDIDPADLAGYMDAATTSFAIEAAITTSDLDAVFHGILAEGLLMGMMIERVQAKPPTITDTARTLARLVRDRLR